MNSIGHNNPDFRLSQVADYKRAQGENGADNVVVYNISEQFQEDIENLEKKKPAQDSDVFDDWMADYGQTLRDAIKESYDSGNFESYEVPKEYQEELDSIEDKKPQIDGEEYSLWAQEYEDAMMNIVDKVQEN